MSVEQFVKSYETALSTHTWIAVEPLVHDEACVTFSTGTVHKGKDAVRVAFSTNFASIEDERYTISDVHWVLKEADIAIYLFRFDWSGVINGRTAEGSGRGTCVVVRAHDRWQLLTEHLGPAS